MLLVCAAPAHGTRESSTTFVSTTVHSLPKRWHSCMLLAQQTSDIRKRLADPLLPHACRVWENTLGVIEGWA